jgi:hypothetical protein
MSVRFGRLADCLLTLCLVQGALPGILLAQETQPAASSAATASAPRLIRIKGTLQDGAGNPLTGSTRVVFALYQNQTDPSPVWQEAQILLLPSDGRYSVLLGATLEGGLPLEIFSADEARWLGVRPDGQAEQPRILLLSVAYALKAADADMLGGRPASAFVLADSQDAPSQPAPGATSGTMSSTPSRTTLPDGSRGAVPFAAPSSQSQPPPSACPGLTSDGTATANQVAKFTTPCNIENSAIFESAGNVGIGNTSPAGALDVSGTAFIRGSLSAMGGAVLAPSGVATTAQGYASTPFDQEVSVFNTTLLRATDYLFRWQAEPVGNDSTNTGATLHLLYGVPGHVLETGLSLSKAGIFTFAPGQTFPALGTVTSIATGAGLTGGPITSSGTISIPAKGITNSLLANSAITVTAGSGLSGGGTVGLGGTVTLTNAAPSSGGTVTSIATGTGLTGGPISKTGTISIPVGGITNNLLANSAITVTAGSGLSGGGTVGLGGTITLTNSAPGSGGTVTSIATGTGLTGGPISKTGTISIPAKGITNALLANSAITVTAGSGLSGGGTVGLGGTVTLTNSAPSSGGTVTSIATGTGLTGGPISKTGTISIPAKGITNNLLANSAITVKAGSGLSGGGVVGLGGSVTLSLPNTCSAGQTLLWNGTTWACGSAGNSNVSGSTDGIAYLSSPTSVTSTAAPTDGQVLMGSTGNAPVLGTLTAGPNITITNGPGSVKISAASARPLSFFLTGGGRTETSISGQQNVTALWGFLLPYSVTTTNLIYDVTTADNTANDYDIGIFNDVGVLVLHLGPTAGTKFAPSAAFHALPWAEAATELVPGRYYLAFTTNCSSQCAAIGAAANNMSFAVDAAAGASTGGALPSTVKLPAAGWSSGDQPTIVIE